MKTRRILMPIVVCTFLLTGCEDTLKNLLKIFKKTAKEVADKVLVSDEKIKSIRESTKNFYEVGFELISHKPFNESDTEFIDIANTKKEDYITAFASGMTTYEQKNGHANITEKGYFSKVDNFLKYAENPDVFTIKKTENDYEITKNEQAIDVTDESLKEKCETAYTLWELKMDYCFSFELNSLFNLKARLIGSTEDNSSKVDFLSKIELKDFKDNGNYIAIYNGEAHKNDGSSDVNIDYIELKYVDYHLQYSLVHTTKIDYNSFVEEHKLTYNKVLYNVELENCFQD